MSVQLQGGTLATVSSYLKTTLLAAIPSLRAANVFDYEVTDLAGFPAATITASEVTGKFIDNARTARHYLFTLRLFIDRNKQNLGASQAELILRTMANDLVNAIDADITLGGNVIELAPFSAKFGYVDRENSNIRVAEVALDGLVAVTWR